MTTKTDGDCMQDMCRTCMTQFSKIKKKIDNKKQSIHEVPRGYEKDATIMELLQLVQPQIKVEVKDSLPKLICPDCIQKLLVSHEFIEMYTNVDTKFRKMLNEVNCPELEVSLEILQKKDYAAEEASLVKENDTYEITKFEYEIEQVNIEDFEKEEESEDEWPDCVDEPLQELSEELEDKETFFVNPYSDSSDNEWIPPQSCQKESSKKKVIQKQNLDYNIKDGTPNTTSVIISKKKISKKRKENEEELLPPSENSDGSIPCQQCESVFDNAKLWRKHMRQHRLEKIPKRKYTKRLNKPTNKQSGQKVYKCDHCGKEFEKISYYRSHMRVHKADEPYLCIECGKRFKVASSLHTHMLRHKGEKTFQCPHCPKKFVCSSGLYGHMMVHTKERPYVCDICGSAFHMAYQLRKHNLYHNNIKNYQCEYCDMKFVTGEKQRRHMRTHTGEKPYRCKYCERAFAQSNDCVKHLRQHLGDNVYQCELCPLRFPLARDLRKHFATHKDDDEETRARNLEARMEEERNLQIKFGLKET